MGPRVGDLPTARQLNDRREYLQRSIESMGPEIVSLQERLRDTVNPGDAERLAILLENKRERYVDLHRRLAEVGEQEKIRPFWDRVTKGSGG